MATRLQMLALLAAQPTGAVAGPQLFTYTGSAQTYIVPAGIFSITVDMIGAGGGDSAQAATHQQLGGKGGRLQATIGVVPGESLQVNVGGQGVPCPVSTGGGGGWNGGGNGMCDSTGTPSRSGGGGGATDIRKGGTGLTDRVLIAGGGGGASKANNGPNDGPGGAGGSNPGQAGQAAGTGAGAGAGNNRNGQGGTLAAGGAAGVGDTGPDQSGFPGTLGQGGAVYINASNTTFCGGGGGGFTGGGGGGNQNSTAPFVTGAGGGGNNYAVPSATGVTHTQGYSLATGNGSCLITPSASGVSAYPPSYSNNGTPQYTGGTATATVTLPTANIGDIRFIFVYSLNVTASPGHTTPAGWSVAAQNNYTLTYNRYVSVFCRKKVDGDSDSVSMTFGHTGDTYAWVVPFLYVGNNMATAVGANTGFAHTDGVSGSVTAQSVTSTAINSRLITFIGGDNWGGSATLGAPSIGTERYKSALLGGIYLEVSDQPAAAVGSFTGPTIAIGGGTTTSATTINATTIELLCIQ